MDNAIFYGLNAYLIDHFGGFDASGNTCSLIGKLGQTWWNRIYFVRMVTTKKCSRGTCKSDSRYPDRFKRNSSGDEVFFFCIFLGKNTTTQSESAGLLHATEAMDLYVQRLITYVAFTLLEKMVLLMTIQTLYQQ